MGSFSIWHWLIVLLFCLAIGLAPYGIYRYANRKPPNAQGIDGPAGVGGWLLLLVVGLAVLEPFLGAGLLSADLMSAESQHPNLKTLATWNDYKNVTWFAFIVVACLSFYAGLGLARGRDMSVVRRAKVLLWITEPAATVILGYFIPLLIFRMFATDTQFTGNLIASTIMAGSWTAYLSKSKRVQATYGNVASIDDG